MFCMLLRKHLSGARIVSVTQPPMERVVDLELEALDELGACSAPSDFGGHGPPGQPDPHRAGWQGGGLPAPGGCGDESGPPGPARPFYHLPPTQEKRDPLTLERADFDALLENAPEEQKLADFLLDHFAGLSPLICRELAYRLTGDVDGRRFETTDAEFADLFFQWMDFIRQGGLKPWLLLKDDKPKDFTYCPITQYGAAMTVRQEECFSAMLDGFYGERETAERIRQRAVTSSKR